MATSTFGKNFVVEKKDSAKFVKEMCKSAPPTLDRSFQSNYTNLKQNEQLRRKLSMVLGK